MTKEEGLRKAQREIWNKGPFFQTEMAQYAIQLGFEKGEDWALSNQWVCVEDKLPETCDVVFIALFNIDTESYQYYVGYYLKEHEKWFLADYGYIDTISYWMPIPKMKGE